MAACVLPWCVVLNMFLFCPCCRGSQTVHSSRAAPGSLPLPPATRYCFPPDAVPCEKEKAFHNVSVVKSVQRPALLSAVVCGRKKCPPSACAPVRAGRVFLAAGRCHVQRHHPHKPFASLSPFFLRSVRHRKIFGRFSIWAESRRLGGLLVLLGDLLDLERWSGGKDLRQWTVSSLASSCFYFCCGYSQGGRDCLSFSAFSESFRTRVYR